MRVVVDEKVQALARGERPASWGVNLNLCSPPPDELRAAIGNVARALADVPGTNLYIYPAPYLHLTVASPFPFTASAPAIVDDDARRTLAEDCAVRAVRAALSEGGRDAGEIEVEFERVELGRDAEGRPTAVILRGAPNAAIDALRAGIPRHLHADADACALGLVRAEGEGWDGLAKAPRPGFVHMTLARFVDQPREPVEDVVRLLDETLAGAWKEPLRVRSRLRLVRESVPYMHLDVAAHTLLE
jgi:2'-5' RNA ligase